MNSSEIKRQICELVQRKIGRKVTEKENLLEAGITSMLMVELVVEIEEMLDIEFEYDSINYTVMESIESISAYVGKRKVLNYE